MRCVSSIRRVSVTLRLCAGRPLGHASVNIDDDGMRSDETPSSKLSSPYLRTEDEHRAQRGKQRNAEKKDEKENELGEKTPLCLPFTPAGPMDPLWKYIYAAAFSFSLLFAVATKLSRRRSLPRTRDSYRPASPTRTSARRLVQDPRS